MPFLAAIQIVWLLSKYLTAIRIVKRVPLAGKRTDSRVLLSQTAEVDEGGEGEMADLTSDSAESLGIALPSSCEFSQLHNLDNSLEDGGG